MLGLEDQDRVNVEISASSAPGGRRRRLLPAVETDSNNRRQQQRRRGGGEDGKRSRRLGRVGRGEDGGYHDTAPHVANDDMDVMMRRRGCGRGGNGIVGGEIDLMGWFDEQVTTVLAMDNYSDGDSSDDTSKEEKGYFMSPRGEKEEVKKAKAERYGDRQWQISMVRMAEGLRQGAEGGRFIAGSRRGFWEMKEVFDLSHKEGGRDEPGKGDRRRGRYGRRDDNKKNERPIVFSRFLATDDESSAAVFDVEYYDDPNESSAAGRGVEAMPILLANGTKVLHRFHFCRVFVSVIPESIMNAMTSCQRDDGITLIHCVVVSTSIYARVELRQLDRAKYFRRAKIRQYTTYYYAISVYT